LWRTWLILGGRGAGKTRTGAEWVRAKVFGRSFVPGPPARRIALIGETLGDVRRVMVEGISGLLNIHSPFEQPTFESSKAQLTWPNGAVAQMFSAEEADSLRGPQFDLAWCDEIAKWRSPEAVWDMLQFALRLGAHPQAVVTTTPRPIPLLKHLMRDEATVVTRAETRLNAANLAPGFIDEVERRYRGTVLWRQEFLGEIVENDEGTLWRRDWIDGPRLQEAPPLQRIVVAVDPPVTATARSDACGIIVAGIGQDRRAYVIDDRSVQGRAPQVWALAVVAAYEDYQADRIVAEVNQGGDLIETVLNSIEANLPITKVRAMRGKWLRAEPVASLYAEGRVVHVGRLEELEDQMTRFSAAGHVSGQSPDRVDALVWALTDLMLSRAQCPQIRKM
jgi:phage terminase large subunit-like protein